MKILDYDLKVSLCIALYIQEARQPWKENKSGSQEVQNLVQVQLSQNIIIQVLYINKFVLLYIWIYGNI